MNVGAIYFSLEAILNGFLYYERFIYISKTNKWSTPIIIIILLNRTFFIYVVLFGTFPKRRIRTVIQ